MSAERRLVALDGIRGVAVLLVVIGHVSGTVAPYGANVGVTLFFVLSGYLITSLLLKEHARFGNINFLFFYARRALRLYPALLAILVLTPLLLLIAGDDRVGGYPLNAIFTGLYLSDFLEASGRSMEYFNHTWSLAVEEQFYLVWPLLLALLLLAAARLGSRSTPWLFGTFVVVLTALALGWRVVATLVLDSDRVYYAPDTNAFILLLGCSMAVLPSTWMRQVPKWAAVAALAALIALSVALRNPSDDGRNWVVVASSVFAVIAIAGSLDGNKILSFRVLTFFGAISYGLYLWHNVLLRIEWGGEDPGGLMRPGLALLSIGVAYASFKLLETPIQRRLKSRVTRVAVPLPSTST
ncbi:acyltransferase [Cnuibacter physcomitrellae]|uniref:acyltransferase family protein n=1 Tax=Cnuibacter physcomitrellae TaxID=1619308 RepID=UPI00217581E4|nr:acyltransferase [Cnuibacter physcomitrellae]MCS5496108.1 acyltransferase [Cnuibacter physcomitrellae]